jgi:hypothetical protein
MTAAITGAGERHAAALAPASPVRAIVASFRHLVMPHRLL